MILYEDERIKGLKSNLKKVRVVNGYTQDALAKLSGVNIKSIAAYEQNPDKLTSTSIGTCIKLADALGCDITDIINFPIK